MEKEAVLVLQEIWAKISARERFVVYGAVAMLVGWLVGQFIATFNPCAGYNLGNLCPLSSFSYFSAGNAGTFALIGLLAAIVAVVVVYLKVAPNMNVNWPMPVAQVLLGVSGLALICGVLVVLMQVSYGLNGAPVTMWLADVIFVGGGAAMAWFSYQEYLGTKAA
ncbi:MAG: hypothetical protein ABSE58_09145 [Candidatus Limnocylindrales bacterium]